MCDLQSMLHRPCPTSPSSLINTTHHPSGSWCVSAGSSSQVPHCRAKSGGGKEVSWPPLSHKEPIKWEGKRTELGEALYSQVPLHAQGLEGNFQQHRRDLFGEVEKRLSHLTRSLPQAKKVLK